ncbi:hypothetical protein LV779_25650 [Streptomyces thinghirensis]|nr:hypothetical protein [Streptomyces thinghirensis]
MAGLPVVCGMTVSLDMQITSLRFTQSNQKRDALDVAISLEQVPSIEPDRDPGRSHGHRARHRLRRDPHRQRDDLAGPPAGEVGCEHRTDLLPTPGRARRGSRRPSAARSAEPPTTSPCTPTSTAVRTTRPRCCTTWRRGAVSQPVDPEQQPVPPGHLVLRVTTAGPDGPRVLLQRKLAPNRTSSTRRARSRSSSSRRRWPAQSQRSRPLRFPDSDRGGAAMGVILWYQIDFPIMMLKISNDVRSGSVLCDAEIVVSTRSVSRERSRSPADLPLLVQEKLTSELAKDTGPGGGVIVDIHLGYLDDPSGRAVVMTGRVDEVRSATRFPPLGIRLSGHEGSGVPTAQPHRPGHPAARGRHLAEGLDALRRGQGHRRPRRVPWKARKSPTPPNARSTRGARTPSHFSAEWPPTSATRSSSRTGRSSAG